MPTLKLNGCAPVPIAHYLKALGILRLVAEQRDASALGGWKGNTFELASTLDREALLKFFLEDYEPTPILVPWSGSDFFKVDRGVEPEKFCGKLTAASTAEKAVEAILCTATSRLRNYREALRLTFAAMDASGVKSKADIEGNGKVQRENKSRLLQALRNDLPENFLTWLDAACVIENDAPSLNTLLGSGGGSDGNSHFSDNFMQSLWLVLADFDAQRAKAPKSASGQAFDSQASLVEALFSVPDPRSKIADLSPVMFDPSRVGGPNSTSGFIGKSASNPWDFILMLEGACLFSGSLGKKTGTNMQAFARFPFLVESTSVGTGAPTLSERGRELWMPLWHEPTSLTELAAIFAEARIEKHGRTAMSGLDAFVALAQHGCDRGISRFQRIGIFRGRVGGDNYNTSVNQGQFGVRENPTVGLLLPLNHWLEQFRRAARSDGAPSSVQQAARALESAIVAFCRIDEPTRTQRVQELLLTLGACEAALARSWQWRKSATKNSDLKLDPVPLLTPQWMREANTGTAEFRLAAALASVTAFHGNKALPMRCHLEPVQPAGGREKRWFSWTERIEPDVVWREGDLADGLNAILARRIMLAGKSGAEAYSDSSVISARPADIAAFIEGRTDDRLLVRLLWGMVLIDFGGDYSADFKIGFPSERRDPPALYALLKLCFSRHELRGTHVPLVPAIHQRSRAGDGLGASMLAARRLRASGLAPAIDRIPARGASVARTAAALLFPLNENDLGEIAGRVLRTTEPETQPATATL